MADIKVKCKSCGSEFNTKRTSEIPEGATKILCNFCPACDDSADDYYHEEYSFEEEPINDPNQTSLFLPVE